MFCFSEIMLHYRTALGMHRCNVSRTQSAIGSQSILFFKLRPDPALYTNCNSRTKLLILKINACDHVDHADIRFLCLKKITKYLYKNLRLFSV